MPRPPNYKELKKLDIQGKISVKANKDLKITEERVLKIFETSIKRNNSGGAYISTSGDFVNKKAYVIIMEEKLNG